MNRKCARQGDRRSVLVLALAITCNAALAIACNAVFAFPVGADPSSAPAVSSDTGVSADTVSSPAVSSNTVTPTVSSDSVTAASSAPIAGGASSRDYLAEVRAAFTAENRAYSARRVFLAIVDPLYAIAVGLFLLFSGLAARLRDVAENMGSRRYVQVLVYLALYVLIAWVLTFPLSWYAGFALEHQFGLSTQTFGAWLADELKGQAVIIAFIGVIPLLSLAYRAIEKNPRGWWLRFAIATLPVVVFMVLIEPIAIDPLFNKFTPLADATLKREILDLGARAGIPARNVYEVDQSTKTRKFNAYVNGFGASQRIVIWDTTLKGMSHDEILFVMGHEMGHYVLGHIWKGIIAISAAAFAIFWLASLIMNALLGGFAGRWKIRAIHDIATIPLLAMTLTTLSLVAQPISNAYSRLTEHEADLFGLEITRTNDAAARAFLKLGAQNRSNPDPAPWLRIFEYTHPPLLERVRSAIEYHPWIEGKPNRFFKGR
ncbi:MAG: M48 family metallopeptidase [Candidatus Eisenbacteria bacterium]|nr:M48 family metallopeptidase [Candidatus Eisenbacteria bacterium]